MISAIVRVNTLTFMLERVLKNLADIDFVLLAVCNYTNDDTQSDVYDILKKINHQNVFCVHFPKMEQKELFNRCVKRLGDLGSDIILINDADEILLKKDRETIIRKMRANEMDYDAVHCTVIDYSKMDCSEHFEVRTHKPVVAVKPNAVFDGNRSAGSGPVIEEINLHHFGYAMEPELMNWKMTNLWYRKQSAKEILDSKKITANPPEELLIRMQDEPK